MITDPADIAFSWWIRSRDQWRCKRCGTEYTPPTRAFQCSHYFGRTKESVRFDEENGDGLCYGCHRIWEKEDREDYRQFKIDQLGEDGFNLLLLRSNTLRKKDRQLAYLYWRQRLLEDFPEYYRMLYKK